MPADFAPRPLHLHTVESLCDDLVSGRAIALGADREPFALDAPASRAALDWYRRNRRKWSSPVQIADAEAIVDAALAASPPSLPAAHGRSSGETRRYRLARVRAHRFAGLHTYGAPLAPPEDLIFEPSTALTLVEGRNGSGKTSLINAILWCLTGLICRPQRAPESATDEFACRIASDSVDLNASSSDAASANSAPRDAAPVPAEYRLTPVTPVPTPREYSPAPDEPLPLDTWVELTLVDDAGGTVTVRRAQTRTTRGKVSEQVSHLDELGLDPLALRIGTVMPALLAHIRLDDPSELGRAVAALTGLGDLADLARHAARVGARLERDLARERETRIARLDGDLAQLWEELYRRFEEFPAMAPEWELPQSVHDAAARLADIVEHLERCKSQALESARETLGDAFDPYDIDARLDLEASIGPAQGELASVGRLPSAARLKALGALEEEQLTAAEDRLAGIRGEADLLAALAANPALARRRQLYARVAAWLLEDSGPSKLDVCPVCGHSLGAAPDPVSGQPVHRHIAEAMSADAAILSQTLESWTRGTLGALARELPAPLRAELDADLPEPRELVRAALARELFEAPCFAQSLAPLARIAQGLCERHLAALPPLGAVSRHPFPSALHESAWALERACHRIERAIAVARWRRRHEPRLREVLRAVLGSVGRSGSESVARADTSTSAGNAVGSHGAPASSSAPNSSGAPAEASPLSERLSDLARTLAGSAPIGAALDLCRRLARVLEERECETGRIAAYAAARQSLAPVIALGELAERQVDELRRLLRERAAAWRDAVYRGDSARSLGLVEVRVDSKGALGLGLGDGGASAPAQHVANASQLRASLLGFLLAFWEHVLASRGGLRLILLDDPQELLDAENREQLAAALPRLVRGGAQLIVTTHDGSFARRAVAQARGACEPHPDHLVIQPLALGAPTLGLRAAD